MQLRGFILLPVTLYELLRYLTLKECLLFDEVRNGQSFFDKLYDLIYVFNNTLYFHYHTNYLLSISQELVF